MLMELDRPGGGGGPEAEGFDSTLAATPGQVVLRRRGRAVAMVVGLLLVTARGGRRWSGPVFSAAIGRCFCFFVQSSPGVPLVPLQRRATRVRECVMMSPFLRSWQQPSRLPLFPGELASLPCVYIEDSPDEQHSRRSRRTSSDQRYPARLQHGPAVKTPALAHLHWCRLIPACHSRHCSPPPL